MRNYCVVLFLIITINTFGQEPTSSQDSTKTEQDSIKKEAFIKHIGNGYFPTRYFDFDLRYLIKFNQYEGFRTGLGGKTNNAFSNKFRLNTYVVYGFGDQKFKYSFGGGLKLNEKHNTWLNLSYTDDLQETGSTNFLTDGRFFQFFEPRLLNIDLFYRHITTTLLLEHNIQPNLLSKLQFTVSNIHPIHNYIFNVGDDNYSNYEISSSTWALQWHPKKDKQSKLVFPRLTLQYTKSFKDVFKSDFNFSKIDFKGLHRFYYGQESYSEIAVTSGLARGKAPLTHLYHAYPNNIRKETIMQRFSVAGLNSFETMFFNEFFSDKFTTIQFKHYLKPFNISEHYKPQMVLISRYAIGDIDNLERHQNVTFNTLEKGYTESGFEINKLLFGFGLSLTYRYGAYHLPSIADNVAFKFTFNITL